MDKQELRSIQTPLKEKYTTDPDSAVITLKAKGNLSDGIACSVETGKAMVEAGLISTMMVAMFLLTVNLPMFSGLSLFILPVPVAVLCIRHNYKAAAGAVFVSAVLTGMLYNPFIALTSAIQYGGTGLILGYSIKTKKEVWTTLVMLAAAIAVGTVVNTAVIITVIEHMSFTEFMNQTIKMYNDSIQQSIQIYKQAGVPTSQRGRL